MDSVLVIGGTGLLGYHTTLELLRRGYAVTSLALPPMPVEDLFPAEVENVLADVGELSDDELGAMLAGRHAVVYAAGADERVIPDAPAAHFFYEANVRPVQRVARLARAAGGKKFVLFNSYTAEFAERWPDLGYRTRNGYPRTRLAQEEVAYLEGDGAMDVMSLRLPYIFGTQPGRKPVWVFLVEQVLGMKGVTMYPRGGSAMVTVHQVGQAIAGALEKNRGGRCYPIGYYNLTWVELLKIVHKYLDCPEKKIITIPNWMYAYGGKNLMKEQAKNGIQGGLNMVKFTDIMCSNLFISKQEGAMELGVTSDDIDGAIGDSVLLSKEILEKKTNVIGMKGE